MAPMEQFARLAISPLGVAKIRHTLNKRQGFSGEIMKRHEWAERAAREGATVDLERQRVNLPRGTFYEFRDVTATAAQYLNWLLTQHDAANDAREAAQ